MGIKLVSTIYFHFTVPVTSHLPLLTSRKIFIFLLALTSQSHVVNIFNFTDISLNFIIATLGIQKYISVCQWKPNPDGDGGDPAFFVVGNPLVVG